MDWKVATTEVFDGWFAELADRIQTEVIAKVELLQRLGPGLGRPHADTLNGSKHANMKELRADADKQKIRIAFAFDPTRTALLLVAGAKQGANQKRFYKQLIAKADQLYDAHLAELAKSPRKKEK